MSTFAAFIVLLAVSAVANGQIGTVNTCKGQGSSAQASFWNTNLKTAGDVLSCLAGTTYTGTSSVLGTNALKAGQTDFALSDVPVQPASSIIVNVPYAIGLMSVYAKGYPAAVGALKMTGCALARAYTCAPDARTYGGAAFVASNPGLARSTVAVLPLGRAEASGTTFTFTSYMGKACGATWVLREQYAPNWAACVRRVTGTPGMRAAYAAVPSALAYIRANDPSMPGTQEAQLQAVVGGKFYVHTQTNYAIIATAFTAATLGTPTNAANLDPTGMRADVYPMVYSPVLLGRIPPLPAGRISPKKMCLCLVAELSQRLVNSKGVTAGDFRRVPPQVQPLLPARCNAMA